ncbi:30S ribosome-binding factor RbfA [Facklamia languida]|uniref:Ribosome-binding factor A n=1 Tax=Facklamia languida CCUG 37842 TaxID=883113 RepID=H3NKI8_9LACT|nr:30S ribosome-binding factor RbfA [Facklamia languida]EHR36371.1 ribosome-binding factor A [Facklamia languida CCUG 37842]
MANYRLGRVRQEILKEVNDILYHQIKDPRVEGVTITDVELTGDLQHATIFYSTLTNLAGQRQKTEAGLKAASGKIRSELAKRISLYKVPEVVFERDQSIDYGQHIDDLLDQIKSEEKDQKD